MAIFYKRYVDDDLSALWKIDAFLMPAVPGCSLPVAPALKSDDFLNDFNWKSILFRCRPHPAARPWPRGCSESMVFSIILLKNSCFFDAGSSWLLAPGRPGAMTKKMVVTVMVVGKRFPNSIYTNSRSTASAAVTCIIIWQYYYNIIILL